ncbi:MAG: DUF1080 domain-containing protein [Planctomycetia bacterium]|jgi:hypothetical protein
MRSSAALMLCCLFLTASACANEAGWTSLFDGKTLAGWKSYTGKPIGSQWVVEDGAIHLATGGGGDIVTEKEFRNFEFQFQWKVAPGANSGVMYRVRPGDNAPYFSGPEYQVLDDSKHRDGGNPKTSAAALYGLIAGAGKELKPVGEWNTGKIVVNGNHIEHWLNGRKVVETDIGTDAWRGLIAGSKFKDWQQFGGAPQGTICLQDHGDKVWFRDLKIRELEPR